jgi:hypothetical protein
MHGDDGEALNGNGVAMVLERGGNSRDDWLLNPV